MFLGGESSLFWLKWLKKFPAVWWQVFLKQQSALFCGPSGLIRYAQVKHQVTCHQPFPDDNMWMCLAFGSDILTGKHNRILYQLQNYEQLNEPQNPSSTS